MASWSKEEIKISGGTEVLAQMSDIFQRRSAVRVCCEVSLNGSLAAKRALRPGRLNVQSTRKDN